MGRVFLLVAAALSMTVAGAVASSQEGAATRFQKMYAEYVAACMKDWDTATHMTRAQWRRTCERVANERARFRAEQDGEVKPLQK
jgi:hypothetical protein